MAEEEGEEEGEGMLPGRTVCLTPVLFTEIREYCQNEPIYSSSREMS